MQTTCAQQKNRIGNVREARTIQTNNDTLSNNATIRREMLFMSPSACSPFMNSSMNHIMYLERHQATNTSCHCSHLPTLSHIPNGGRSCRRNTEIHCVPACLPRGRDSLPSFSSVAPSIFTSFLFAFTRTACASTTHHLYIPNSNKKASHLTKPTKLQYGEYGAPARADSHARPDQCPHCHRTIRRWLLYGGYYFSLVELRLVQEASNHSKPLPCFRIDRKCRCQCGIYDRI